ncbi:hypothetical protein Sjap_002708 [Stephania japonica]|uniref:Retrotransposon gag domain-containing protein n=1 Tax=Stephania japonica TaxID=461633 RepID=A0AAP0PST0_9MAGN
MNIKFHDLKQGKETVVEYEVKFERWVRVATEIVAMEEIMVEKFIEGLWNEIKHLVMAIMPITYIDAVHIAKECKIEHYKVDCLRKWVNYSASVAPSVKGSIGEYSGRLTCINAELWAPHISVGTTHTSISSATYGSVAKSTTSTPQWSQDRNERPIRSKQGASITQSIETIQGTKGVCHACKQKGQCVRTGRHSTWSVWYNQSGMQFVQ